MTGKILWQDKPPTETELADMRQAEYDAAVEAREAAVLAHITASPEYRAFVSGATTLTAYREDAARIRARFEADNPLPPKP